MSCFVIALKSEHINAWMELAPGQLSAMYAILDDPIDAYYKHELPDKNGVKNNCTPTGHQ